MANSRNFPGITRFQSGIIGKTVTGPSGVIPYWKDKAGNIRAPIPKMTKQNFMPPWLGANQGIK